MALWAGSVDEGSEGWHDLSARGLLDRDLLVLGESGPTWNGRDKRNAASLSRENSSLSLSLCKLARDSPSSMKPLPSMKPGRGDLHLRRWKKGWGASANLGGR